MDVSSPMEVDETGAEEETCDEREFAECILKCKIDIGESALKPLLEKICALLNSGGGILKIEITGWRKRKHTRTKIFDTFWTRLEERLVTIIGPSDYDDVFDRKINGDEVLLFVKAPNHFCTVESNLFTPLDAKALPANYDKVLKLLKEKKKTDIPQVSIQNLPSLPEKFVIDKVLEFHESKQIQLKHYTSSNGLFHKNNGDQRDNIKKWISAFGNGSGGIIILGVDDKTGKIKGERKDDYEKGFSSMVDDMSQAWCFTPHRGTHWDLKVFPVEGESALTVPVLYIAGMENLGGIFTKCPKSFELRPGPHGTEELRELEFGEWKQKMLGFTEDETKGTKMSKGRFQLVELLKGPLLMLEESAEQIRETFFAAEPNCPVVPKGFEENLPEPVKQFIRKIQQKCSGSDKCSLLVAARSWLSCIKKTENDREQADDIICDLLLFDKELGGIHLFALCRKGTKERSLSYAQTTAKAIKKALVVEGGCYKKFYLAYHLVSCNDEAAVLLDRLSPDDRYPHNYQMDSRGKVEDVLNSLVIVLAKFPSVLSNKQGISFFNLLTVEQFELVNYYNLERHKELWIKGAAGTGKTLVAVEFIKKLRRRDPTLTPKNILYVCETVGLKQKISNIGICQCECRRDFMIKSFPDVRHVIMDEVHSYRSEDGDWLKKARTLVYQHCRQSPKSESGVTSDYGSKLAYSSSDSKSQMDLDLTSVSPPTAESSVQLKTGQHRQSTQNSSSDTDSEIDTDPSESCVSKPCDTDYSISGRGYLWFLIDKRQAIHDECTGIPDENYQEPSFLLTKVIRNTIKIFEPAIRLFGQDSNALKNVEMGHNFDGEDIIYKYLEEAGLKEVLLSLLKDGYSKEDIAIIYGSEDRIPEREDLCRQLELPKIVDATDNDSKYLVVSDIRNYSGLERPVVILMDIAKGPLLRNVFYSTNYSGTTRAMVKVIYLRPRRHSPKLDNISVDWLKLHSKIVQTPLKL